VGDRLRLYVTRHGKAEPESPSGRDEDRPLKKKGEKQAEYLAHQFLASDRRPQIILVSRLLRAQETAAIVAEALDCPVREESTLGLGHPVSEVLEVLEIVARNNGVRDVMLIGHNPQLEGLVSVLTDGPAGTGVRMRTGECAVLEIAPEGMHPGGARLLDMIRLVSPD